MGDRQKGQPCEVENCRSTRYTRYPDGHLYCARGHRVLGDVLTQQEEFGPGGSQQPGTSKKSKRKAPESVEKASITLTGVEAIELYLQCLQLVLRHQVSWLVRVKGYPEELEAVVQDLWALRLEMLKDILQDPDDDDAMQLFSSQTDTEASDSDRTSRHRSAHAKSQTKRPRLTESLSLLYVSFMLMRLPICASDVYSWVLHEDFAFLRAVNKIPQTMWRRLNTKLQQPFQPRRGIGALEDLNTVTQDLVGAFDRHFGLTTPPINHKLLLFRFVTELSLPLDIFTGVERLQQLLGLNFCFVVGQKVTHVSEHPEVRLVALLVILTKLLYPFDDKIRQPRSSKEPGALVMDWDSWNENRARFAQGGDRLPPSQTSHEAYLNITEHDVLSMSGGELDGYLDWFGRTWTDKEEPQGSDAEFRRAMLKMFPVDEQSRGELGVEEQGLSEEAKNCLERLRLSQGSLIPRQAVRDEPENGPSLLRPGQAYCHYRTEEDIPERARPFLEAAAGLAGLPVATLVIAVFQIERKLQKWATKERQARNVRQQTAGHLPDDDVQMSPI